MFVIVLTYKKPLEIIDQYLFEHRAFLDQGYASNFFITSGPQNPRTGGIIISQLKHRDQIENILKEDPFYIHDVVDYEIIEFEPLKHHLSFAPFIEFT